MDKTAINYNVDALKDDGSCLKPSIGDLYQGGIVGYYLLPGDSGYDANQIHGLLVAKQIYPTLCKGIMA